MPVDPNLDRIGKVGADLDERRTEIGVPQIKVETRHPPVCLGEGEPRDAVVAVMLVAGEHVLKLLGNPDRCHPGHAGSRLRVQVAAHHIDLPVALLEPDNRDAMVLGERADVLPELGPDLLHDRRRRDPVTQMLGHERHDLPAHLQVRHVSVEIDSIQALHIEDHVTIKKIVHRQRRSHNHQPGRTRPAGPTRTSAVRGEASLGKEPTTKKEQPPADRGRTAFRPDIPPTTGPATRAADSTAELDALVRVIRDRLPERLRVQLGTATLRTKAQALAGVGWTEQALAMAITDREWNGAHGGAVIAWLTDLASIGPWPTGPNLDSRTTTLRLRAEAARTKSAAAGPDSPARNRPGNSWPNSVGVISDPGNCWFQRKRTTVPSDRLSAPPALVLVPVAI